MLRQFGFRGKLLYLCIAKRRRPGNTGFSPLFLAQKVVFYLGDRKNYLVDKIFFGLGRIFFGLGRCAQQLFRKFFGPRNIKNIKVFGAKEIGF